MAVVPTIAGAALGKMLAYADQFAVDGRALIAQLGIDPTALSDPDARVPVATMHRAWDELCAHAPRADGAVLAAERYVPADYGLVGFVVMTSATLDEAFSHFVRFIRLWTDEPRFTREGTTVRAAYHTALPDGPGKRIGIEAAFTEIVQAARLVTQQPIAPRAVRFAHPAPGDIAAHRAFFACDVEFSARDNALDLAPDDLARAPVRADPQLAAYLRSAANRALADRGGDDASLQSQIRAILGEELARGIPSAAIVARRLTTSERTLRRRLDEEGTSFRELVDATRAQLARGYVADPKLPLAEVAFLLGFSEPSAFHRAFKRWTGVTPAAFREKNR